MTQVDVTVKVEKEAYEVAVAVKEVLAAIKAKKPVAQIIAEEFGALTTAVQGVQEIPAEYTESKGAFIRSFMIPVSDMVDALTAPAPTPAA